MADVNDLTAEFTQRLTDSEKRLTGAIRVSFGFDNVYQGSL